MATTTTPDRIRAALRRGLGDVVVHTTRPDRLFQLEIPAYALDGDGLQVYVEATRDGFHVTDLGATFMRASYAGELTRVQEAEVEDLVRSQGLQVEDGALGVVVAEGELFAAVMGMVQAQVTVETAVSRAHAPKRARTEEDFRAMVQELLRDTFASRVTFDHGRSDDTDKDFAVDAFVEGPHPLGVAIVANAVAAERAVGTKLSLINVAPFTGATWLYIPRDAADLNQRTRRRLEREYEPVVTLFEASEKAVVSSRLLARAS